MGQLSEEFSIDNHGVTDELVAAIEPAVGKIALSWGFIESHLRAVYWTLERTKGVPKPTEKASFEELTDHIRAVCLTLPEFDESLGSLGGLLRAAASEARSIADVRNTVCHWTLAAGKGGKKPKVKFVQWRGNNGLNVWKEKWYGVAELRGVATRSAQLGNMLAELAYTAVMRLEPDIDPSTR